MRDFCTSAQPSGSVIVNILVNESRSLFPFWNVLLMEHFNIDGRPYIFGVQTNLDKEKKRLCELFAMNETCVRELARLRNDLQDVVDEAAQDGTGLYEAANKKLMKFLKGMPASLLPLELLSTTLMN